MENYKVYKLTSPEGKLYIGATKNTEHRWNNGRNYTSGRIAAALREYPWELWEKEILVDGLTKEEAYETEKRLIKEYRTQDPDIGYNICDGGEGSKGWHMSEDQKLAVGRRMKGNCPSAETRRKLSEAQKGEKGNNYGKHPSSETLRRMSEAKKGHYVSEETKAKISKANKGKPGLPANEAQYNALMERNNRVRRTVYQYTKDGLFIKSYSSAYEVAKEFGIAATSISACCHGRTKSCHGYVWKFEEPSEHKYNILEGR